MTFHPAGNSREQILLIGSWGAGKSYAWLSIAKRCPESHFYIIDTTYDAERMVEGLGLENITIQHVDEWDDWVEASEKFRGNATKDDWLVVDLISDLWEASQRGYSDKMFGKEIDEWVLEAKKSGEGIAGNYGENWGMINKMYQRVMMSLLRFPGHKIACAPAEPVQEPDRAGKGGDTIEMRQLYGRYKLKPKGQKALGFQFHSIFVMMEKSKGNWIMSTVRDRNREGIENQPVTDFGINYLLKVAGWRP